MAYGVSMNSICYECQLRKKLALARSLGTDEQATMFAKRMLQELASAPKDLDSTQFGALAEDLLRRIYHVGPDRLKGEKEFSNRFAMERIDGVRKTVEAAEDPVYAALQYSTMANYIDFSALQGEVNFEDLDNLLSRATELELDKATYARFCKELEAGKKLLYLTDNAGEIAFDNVLAQQLHRKYPHLEIVFCVRGKPAFNDALREDAEAVGITFPVIDNGTNVGGTPLHRVSAECKEAINSADVILAKGMGNVESMHGCGYNIYYAFLVKCDRLIQVFQKPKLTPMFLPERQ
ncbi:MAG: DUF89 family protein [Oscillospiraceae bacterium]|nr:DUF89 family protein [Oscillospiraceae bacterium]